MSFPNTKNDFLSPTNIDENPTYKMINNHILQSRCQNGPSLKNKPDSNKAKVFHAAHKYFAHLTELIRSSVNTDIIQMIDTPINNKQRRYLASKHNIADYSDDSEPLIVS